jgi:hypothetical protein
MKPATAAALENAKLALEMAKTLLDAEAKEAIALSDPPELVRFYADMREGAEALRESVASLSKLEQNLSYEAIPACFDAAGIQNINVTGYGLVSLTRRWSCSFVDKEAGFKYLRDHGQGGMIIETVPAPTLGAWAKSEVEEKGVEPPDSLFKMSVNRYVSLRRSK